MHNLRETSILGPAGQIETLIDSPKNQPRAVAICAHPHPLMGGTMHHKTIYTVSRAFIDLDCVAIRFNFRGVQKSEGQYDYAHGEIDDMEAVYHWVRQHYSDLPIILSGFSFGSVVALHLAKRLEEKELPISHLVLVGVGCSHFSCPFPEKTPSLMIHGEKDEIVSLDIFLQWASMPPESTRPVIIIPMSDHFFSQRLSILKKAIIDHFTAVTLS